MMDLKEKRVGIVGEKNFSDKPQDLVSHSRDFSLVQGCRPACVVRPRNTEQVQKVIRLANEARTPIIPSSSRVHFHGNTVPKLGGIVMDLKEMNRILDIDELNRKARIEPGVTWGQIQEVLEKIDSRMKIGRASCRERV